jgi:hypothetical protein
VAALNRGEMIVIDLSTVTDQQTAFHLRYSSSSG